MFPDRQRPKGKKAPRAAVSAFPDRDLALHSGQFGQAADLLLAGAGRHHCRLRATSRAARQFFLAGLRETQTDSKLLPWERATRVTAWDAPITVHVNEPPRGDLMQALW